MTQQADEVREVLRAVWAAQGEDGAALVGGLLYGAVLRATRPDVHARIGLGNEAFQLEKAAGSDPAAH